MSIALQVSEDPPETVVHELTEFVQSNGGDGVVFFPYLGYIIGRSVDPIWVHVSVQ